MGHWEMFRKGELDYSVKSQNNGNQKSEVEIIRNNLHNLDLQYSTDKQIFEQETFKFIYGEENFKNYVYLDGERKRTVGYGFNMDKPEAQSEWQQVFPDNIPSFDDISTGNAKISQVDAKKLAQYNIKLSENAVKNFLYDKNTSTDIYNKLNPNEKIALISASFNGWVGGATSIVGKNQKQFLTDYVIKKDKNSLLLAVEDLKHSSDVDSLKPGKRGLQNRRQQEALLMDSTECNYFTLPGDKLPLKVLNGGNLTFNIGDRILRNTRTNQNYVSGKYFVWYHNPNSKNPFQYHVDLDGKIFAIDDEQFDWLNSKKKKGCHCEMEQLPDFVHILD